jgi:hypothetical protein
MVDVVNACSSVLAWLWGALVDVGFAIYAGEAGFAKAGVFVNTVNALSAVLARVWVTFVDVDFAIVSGKSGNAIAGMAVDTISALAAILAWRQSALVNVDVAILSFKSSRAVADVVINEITAKTSVLALGSGLQLATFSGAWLGNLCHQFCVVQIVDAITPESELLSSNSAVALRVGIFGGFTIRSVGVVTPAFTFPLKTGVLVSFRFALIKALLLITDVEEFSSSRTELHVPLFAFFVDPAAYRDS